jgi:hypothetical protein
LATGFCDEPRQAWDGPVWPGAGAGATTWRYWVNFASGGNPNGAGLPRWPAFGGADPAHQLLRLEAPIRAGGVEQLERLRVFDAVYDGVRGRPFGAR